MGTQGSIGFGLGNIRNGESLPPGNSFGNVWPGGSVSELRDPGFGSVGGRERRPSTADSSCSSAVIHLANRPQDTSQDGEPQQGEPTGTS